MVRFFITALLALSFFQCATPRLVTRNIALTQMPSVVSADLSSTGGVSLADINGDLFVDLYVTNGFDVSNPANAKPQRNRVYINTNGQFKEDTASVLSYEGGLSSGSIWADADNDGDLDVFVVNQRNQPNQFFDNSKNGFKEVKEGPWLPDKGDSYSCAWVDVDADGLLDVYVGNGGLSHRGPDFLYRNLGGNNFEAIRCEITTDTTATIGGIWADFNNDGRTDFFLTDQFGPELFFFNEGNWKFKRTTLQRPKETNVFPNASAAAADFDNDGDLDVFLCGMYGSFNTLYVNDGQGNFSLYKTIDAFPEGGHTYLAHWLDLDNNGWQDLIVLNWGSAPVVYSNHRGAFSKADVPNFTNRVLYPSSIASADIDRDGAMDFVIGQWPNFPGEYCRNLIFRNTTPAKNWIAVRLVGTTSNKSAIGAKVFLKARTGNETLTQLREVIAQPSWRSQSDLVQHFGVAEASSVMQVEVHWPSGKKSLLSDIEVNQVLTMVEP